MSTTHDADVITPTAPSELAHHGPAVADVRILGRQPAQDVRREIDLFYSSNGKRVRKTVQITRPTRFDDITVAVVDEISPLPPLNLNWPDSLIDVAHQGRRALREMTSRYGSTFRHASPMLDARQLEPNNVAILLVECIPLALHAADVLGSKPLTVFRKVGERFQSLLDEVGLDTVQTPKRLEGPMVHVRGSRSLQVYDLLGTFDCPALTFFPEIYDRFTFPGTNLPDKIFLARRGARALLNHDEAERMLRARGYETIYMEDFPMREQFAIAQHAKHVVAIHGAAMALLAFNKDLDSVIELSPPHTYHEYYPLSLPRARKYAVQLPDFDESVPNRGWEMVKSFKDAPFAIDLEALEQALDEGAS